MHTTITRRVGLILLVLVIGLAGSVSVWAGPDVQSAPGSTVTPTPTPKSSVLALVAVERAIVFPEPDRNAVALTYLYERERVPVFAQSTDGVFLLVRVGSLYGWVLSAQVDLEGGDVVLPVTDTANDISVLIATPTFTPFPTVTPAVVSPSQTQTLQPTLTPAPDDAGLPDTVTQPDTLTQPDITAQPDTTGQPSDQEDDLLVLPGVAPPIAITLPENWEAVDLVVPMLNFDDEVRDIPLTVYFGELDRDVYGLIYLYWGFPNTVDWASGDYNLWADGVQILRGSLVGQSCNLGVYDQQMFPVGEFEGVGADYQASECTDENDTAGWFATLRANDLTFAFFTAVEPWTALGDYHATLQAILDSVEFVPVEQSSP